MKIISKFENLPNNLKTFLLTLMDGMIVILSFYVAITFEENMNFTFKDPAIQNTVLSILVMYLMALHLLGTYKGMVKYFSTKDYITIGASSIIIAALFCTAKEYFRFFTLETNIILLAAMFTAVFSVVFRVFLRGLQYTIISRTSRSKQRLLIIGAGNSTSQIIKTLQTSLASEYTIVGIIDDDPDKYNRMMYGVKVIGDRNDIVSICEEKNIDVIFFSIANIKPKEKNKILRICDKTDARVKMVLPLDQIISEKNLHDAIRDVEVEDLLGREQIELNNNKISDYISGKVVLVTGAGGSIGSELCRQIVDFKPKKLVMLDIYENTLYETEMELRQKNKNAPIVTVIGSVRDQKRMEEIFDKYKPQIVFHAAAHKHVPLMEISPIEAIKNNVFGTLNVAECSDKYGVEKFTFISTDKAVNPTSIMGASKRICEMIIQAKNRNSKTTYSAVRFGNVLGSHGSVIPLFKKQIEDGGPVTVTHKEITRYFMLIPEAVGLILQSATFANGGEIFVLDMGEPVKIYDLAQTLIKMSGKNISIEIVGLRKGEKLYEELLMAEEGLIKTLHEKIMISRINAPTDSEMEQNIEKLRNLVEGSKHSRSDVKEVMKEIVPTFIDLED
ncbi:MAG: polysaccharide biosynthesis protein [Clostridia bacterium]|nr:polysaccharide biosynthesis protein [Clostridia bacterium]